MNIEDIKIVPKWRKNKDELWNETFAGVENVVKPASKTSYLSFWKYTVAAAIAAMVILCSAAALYRTSEQAARGSHLAVTLPDGSKVKLNADSKLNYKPYLWFISRNVELEGEAFFEVKPGSRFAVKSAGNEVRVLGTNFNVFAREERYNVTCLTGKIEVTANHEKWILTPNMQVNLRDGELDVFEDIDATQYAGWTQNKFNFIGVPLADVIKEIERQYDIHISTTSKLDYLYTGNFSRDKQPEEVLEIIGKPFGITFSIIEQ